MIISYNLEGVFFYVLFISFASATELYHLFKRMSISLLKKSVLPLTKMPFYTYNFRALIEKS